MTTDRKVTYTPSKGTTRATVSPEEVHRTRRVERTIKQVQQALKDVKDQPDELEEVTKAVSRKLKEASQ